MDRSGLFESTSYLRGTQTGGEGTRDILPNPVWVRTPAPQKTGSDPRKTWTKGEVNGDLPSPGEKRLPEVELELSPRSFLTPHPIRGQVTAQRPPTLN